MRSIATQMASAFKDTPRKEYVKWKNVDYCCLCGSTKNPNKFTNVFSAPGKRKKIAFKIKVTLNVNICGEGSLRICRVCERKLNNFTDFVHRPKPILESVIERASSKRPVPQFFTSRQQKKGEHQRQ